MVIVYFDELPRAMPVPANDVTQQSGQKAQGRWSVYLPYCGAFYVSASKPTSIDTAPAANFRFPPSL